MLVKTKTKYFFKQNNWKWGFTHIHFCRTEHFLVYRSFISLELLNRNFRKENKQRWMSWKISSQTVEESCIQFACFPEQSRLSVLWPCVFIKIKWFYFWNVTSAATATAINKIDFVCLLMHTHTLTHRHAHKRTCCFQENICAVGLFWTFNKLQLLEWLKVYHLCLVQSLNLFSCLSDGEKIFFFSKMKIVFVKLNLRIK